MTSSPSRVMAGGAIGMSLSTMPGFLLASLAVFVRPELGFSEARLGLAFTVFWSVTALTSAPGGRLSERLGAYRSLVLCGTCSTVSMVGIGLVSTSWWSLLAFLVVGGLGNGMGQVSLNLALARGVPEGRRGLAFGVKHAAGPATTLLGGLAVPLIGLALGWRWTMVLGPVFFALLLVVMPRDLSGGRPPTPGRPGRTNSSTRSLLLLAAAAGMGAVAANGMVAFLVESTVRQGISTSTAGMVMAFGSLFAVVVRLVAGVLADRRGELGLGPVVGLLALGCLGYALLAVGTSAPMVLLGAALAFGGGWGWPGMFSLAVVTRNPDAPASATGITQSGVFLGAIVGPLLFGSLVTALSYRHAWWTMVVFAVAAVALMHWTAQRQPQDVRRGARPRHRR